MAKLLSIFSITIYCSLSFAEKSNGCFDKVDSPDYFYVNGVWNFTQKIAESSRDLLSYKLQLPIINLLYNKSDGYGGDIIETFGYIDISLKHDKSKDWDYLINEPKYKEKSEELYKLLSKDKINIIIAHSEGNLFADHFCVNNPDDMIIENIAIAPPLSKLRCNRFNTYVLFDNDHVINQIEVAKKEFLPYYPTHKGTGLLSHSLKSYLENDDVVKTLKNGISKTIDESYKENFSFNLSTLEIEEYGNFQKLINNYNKVKESIGLWGREKKAFINLLSYYASIASNIGEKDFTQKVAEVELPAQDEKEYADMMAYYLIAIDKCCHSFLSPELKKLSKKIIDNKYFESKDIIEPMLFFQDTSDWKISIPCSLAAENINKNVDFSVKFQKVFPSILHNGEKIDLSYTPQSDMIEKIKIGTLKIEKEDSQKVITVFSPRVFEPSEGQKEFKDRLSSCNTIKKLSTKQCVKFLNYMDKTYFSKN
jgi:hypothetical protein